LENANVLLFLKENEEYVNWTNTKADATYIRKMQPGAVSSARNSL